MFDDEYLRLSPVGETFTWLNICTQVSRAADTVSLSPADVMNVVKMVSERSRYEHFKHPGYGHVFVHTCTHIHTNQRMHEYTPCMGQYKYAV
jgi:hypothetical protein